MHIPSDNGTESKTVLSLMIEQINMPQMPEENLQVQWM